MEKDDEMTTHPTEADFKKATFAIAPNFLPMMRDSYNKPPWGDRDGGRFSDAAMVTIGARIIPERPSIPEWGDIPEDLREAMVERVIQASRLWDDMLTSEDAVLVLEAALTGSPTRPEWADAPAVLARAKGRPEGAPESVWIFNHLMKRWESIVGWEAQENLTDVTPLYPEGRAPEVGQ